MPFYDYRCYACGHRLEAMQKMSDPPLMECPDCGKKALKKQLSAAGFRLKGSGWYETDFKKGRKKNLHESGNKAPAAGNTKAAGGDKKAAGGSGSGKSSGS